MWTVRRGCRRLGDNKVKLGPNWVNPPSQDKMLLCLSELSLQAPTGAQTLPFDMWYSHIVGGATIARQLSSSSLNWQPLQRLAG